MIRGYGLKSANDYPERDPKDFSFWVVDVMEQQEKIHLKKQDKIEYKEVHQAKN